jgi:hypothetical protein
MRTVRLAMLRPVGKGRHEFGGDRCAAAWRSERPQRGFAGDRNRFGDITDPRSAFTVATKLPVNSMPWRCTVLNPGNEKETE